MPLWSWHTSALDAKKCEHCKQALRFHTTSGGVVKWIDGKLYAVGCLLEKLAAAL